MERPVANDDQITIDLIAKVEDKEVANQTDVVYLVTEHNNRPVEGFHAYLLDMALNETKTFTIPFPVDTSFLKDLTSFCKSLILS